ncbi:MAG: glycosyltransferase [Muribaculaceae bacterium]|nr:glycosyltransferase [Muribaculaceae bacterium]MDE5858598.1 glycosyltransferase [Muribaculaceae bacterium]MDE7155911.1 glycosyltransferase [Muribaculaceae bacterium]MDE7368694.1 glycosyltransferase [Muribaculaceae bacterium]
MSTPFISIITVTYNAAATVKPTLESIKKQTFTDYEFILMDGASTDNTLDVVNQADIKGARISSSPDNGLYYAMNKGLGEATGDYVMFLNAGDSFHSENSLKEIFDAANREDTPGVVYGQTDIVDVSRKKIADRHLIAPENLTLDSFREGMVVCHQAFIALRRIAPLFNTSYRYSADFDWCVQCLQHARRVAYTGTTLIDYLSEGISTANRRRSLIERFKIMSYYYGFFPTLKRHFRFVKRFVKYQKALKQ